MQARQPLDDRYRQRVPVRDCAVLLVPAVPGDYLEDRALSGADRPERFGNVPGPNRLRAVPDITQLLALADRLYDMVVIARPILVNLMIGDLFRQLPEVANRVTYRERVVQGKRAVLLYAVQPGRHRARPARLAVAHDYGVLRVRPPVGGGW